MLNIKYNDRKNLYVDRKIVFHEKQSYFSRNCAIYSVNNLLGEKKYSENDFNRVCDELNEELGIPKYDLRTRIIGGNYDFMVINRILEKEGLYITHEYNGENRVFDLCETLKRIGQKIEGLILNKTNGLFSNHWFTIKKIDLEFYNVDSKIPAAELLYEHQLN